MKLALDGMGGDNAPAAAVRGAVLFARDYPQHEVVLVGDEARLRAEGALPSNIAVRHASETVGMEDSAAAAIRGKRDSSLRVCFELLKAGEVSGIVSAGHSGAMMAGALLLLGRLKAVERPAIAAIMPGLRKQTPWLLLDAGANIQCTPEQLLQFAVMGEAYLRKRFAIQRPRVALLSNGEEESKGTDLTRAALAMLKKSDLDVMGYIEGKDVFNGKADLVVTDGFTGNVMLKTSEGTAMSLLSRIKQEVQAAPLWQRMMMPFLRPALNRVRQLADYAEYGGAPLLGVNGVALVAHGRSSPRAFKNALRSALEAAEGGFLEHVSERLRASVAWT